MTRTRHSRPVVDTLTRSPRRSTRNVVAAAVLSSAMFGAVPASADPDQSEPDPPSPAAADLQFLTALHAERFHYDIPGRAIATGRTMCDYVEDGRRGSRLVSDLQRNNNDLLPDRAQRFIAISLGVFCPDQLVAGLTEPTPEEAREAAALEQEQIAEGRLPWSTPIPNFTTPSGLTR